MNYLPASDLQAFLKYDRNLLLTPLDLTSRHFFFQNSRPAIVFASRFYLPLPQVPVCYFFQLVVN